jgi:hypothetical protein
MLAKVTIVAILLIGVTSTGMASSTPLQIASMSDQKLDALAAMVRAVTSQGLFAEEYDALLEVAQEDPQLRETIMRHLETSPR